MSPARSRAVAEVPLAAGPSMTRRSDRGRVAHRSMTVRMPYGYARSRGPARFWPASSPASAARRRPSSRRALSDRDGRHAVTAVADSSTVRTTIWYRCQPESEPQAPLCAESCWIVDLIDGKRVITTR
jgi:hypothetical protein